MKRAADDDGADAGLAAEAPEEKKGKAEEARVECAICLSEGSDVEIRDHDCSTCKKGAWMICESCHNHILSRACPVCKGHYAPLFLYAIPGVCKPPLDLGAESRSAKETFERFRALAFLDMKRNMFSASVQVQNVCVWRALFDEEKTGAEGEDEVGKMFFCFMGAAAWDEEGAPSDQHLIFEMTMSRARVASGRFTFDNSVWDELMEAMENAEVDDDDEDDDDEEEEEVEEGGGVGAGGAEAAVAEEIVDRANVADGTVPASAAVAPPPAPASTVDTPADAVDDAPAPPTVSTPVDNFIAAVEEEVQNNSDLGEVKQYIVPTDMALKMMKGQWMTALLKGHEVHAMTMVRPEQWAEAERDLEEEVDRCSKSVQHAAEKGAAGGGTAEGGAAGGAPTA